MRLKLPESEQILRQMLEIYKKAEKELLSIIAQKRARGLIDYGEAAALARVHATIMQLLDKTWDLAPKVIESRFYEKHPEAARLAEPILKHHAGYTNADVLSITETNLVQRLTANLMGELLMAANTAERNTALAIGRIQPDKLHALGLRAVAEMQAGGKGSAQATSKLIQLLNQEKVTAFIDQAGRQWGLYTYASTVIRTTSRQAEILSVITCNPDHDLYQISSHGTTCALCAPLEGRVYSKSGTDPDFPPLALAFGKVDAAGPDSLENSYLNIHPNCLHVLVPWTPVGRSREELVHIKQFSSFKENPPTRDPRTQAQIEAYRRKEQGRARYLANYRQYERYRLALGDAVPKTFQTFEKHKLARDQTYKKWVLLYRRLRRDIN